MWNGVSIVQKPTGELLTLAKLKSRLRVDHDDDDDLLTDLLKGAIARIDGPNGIGFAMMEQAWRKSMDAFPHTIILPGAPIKSVTSITYVDPAGEQQTLDHDAYRVDVDCEPVRIVPAVGKFWPATHHVIGAVKVNYVLGEVDAANVAPDLIDAVCLLVGHRYENREAVNVGNIVSEFPLGFEAIVAEHRRGKVLA
ncbi:hypothetical protein GRZ55_11615 [Chelativorans sp. ZYF759]|uniref:head-tail connector protein n=1 Tax=Chelativorans sp. ZYF759 TaxID=2692213 RepID=UPI00145DC307|nr:head-tail connector protein [Chelativorans sp. ZYF759]NMG39891.1 hypothetical protein [Chelativorans sp. ZYF759]